MSCVHGVQWDAYSVCVRAEARGESHVFLLLACIFLPWDIVFPQPKAAAHQWTQGLSSLHSHTTPKHWGYRCAWPCKALCMGLGKSAHLVVSAWEALLLKWQSIALNCCHPPAQELIFGKKKKKKSFCIPTVKEMLPVDCLLLKDGNGRNWTLWKKELGNPNYPV